MTINTNSTPYDVIPAEVGGQTMLCIMDTSTLDGATIQIAEGTSPFEQHDTEGANSLCHLMNMAYAAGARAALAAIRVAP